MSQQTPESPTPASMPRYWDDDQVDHYITSEAHTKKKTPEQFRETHVDIDRIHADTLTPLGIANEFVSQEQVLDAITRSNLDDPNRIFILRGEPGSGKSQLCEWTKYQINGYGNDDTGVEDYAALHVSRSQTRMDDIVDVLTEPLDVDPDVGNIEDLDPEDAASAIVEYMRGIWSTEHLTDDEKQELTAARGDESDLRTIFAKNIEEYQQALDSRDENPDFNLLTRSDFRDLRLALSFGRKLTENRDLMYPVLKNEAHEYLSRNLVGDFKEQLQEYSELYQDKGIRPVLICEDLTTFSVLKEQLLDHIFELSSSNYDIVLGWTVGWEQDNIDDALARSDAATYMKGRAEGYLTMTDEDGEAFFLDEDASVALARSYMDAIKRNSTGSGVPEDVEAAFDDLYPFTDRFVQTAYLQLHDEGSSRKTPRLLLLRVVKHCLKSTLPPYEAMKSNSFVDTPAPNIAMRYDELYLDIARWYGVPVDGDGNVVRSGEIPPDGGIGVRTRVLETFGVEPPEDAPQRGGYVVFQEGEASKIISTIVQRGGGRGTKKSAEKDDETGNDETGDDGTGDDGGEAGDDDDDDDDDDDGDIRATETTEEEKKIQEFLDWIKSGDEYPSADTLHTGALATLNRWHEPTRLANPNASTSGAGAIYYARGDEIPVSIQGALERQASIDVTVEWGEDNVSLYRPMVEYGLLGEFTPQTTNFDQLRAWADTTVAQFKQEMRGAIEDCFPPGDPQLTIEKTLVLAQFFLVNAARGYEIEDERIPAEVVFEDYDSDQPYGKPLAENFEEDSAFGEAFNDLAMSSSDIDDLVEGFFLLKSNVVDYERLSDARRAIAEDLEGHIDAAMAIDTGELAEAFKVGTTRSRASMSVAALFDRIADYATELQRLTTEEDAAHVQEKLEPVDRWYDSTHTAADLADWFETLEACRGVMDVSDRNSYERARELLGLDEEDGSPTDLGLDSFRSDIELFRNMDDATGVTLVARLHDFARSRHEQDAWQVYEAFDELIGDLQAEDHATGADLEHRIRQLDEYSDYEEKHQEIHSITEDL
mgnify:CR=1 FL=1